MALTQCDFQPYCRNPTYLTTKFVLCIAGGLLIGFTFYKTSDSETPKSGIMRGELALYLFLQSLIYNLFQA
jgi:hypothetical protein